MGRKHLLCLDMQADVMAHVDEVRFLRCQATDILQRFADGLVRTMRFRTQSIHYQHIQTLQEFKIRFGHGEHIRHPSHTADTIAQDGKLAMHHTDRQDFHLLALGIAHVERNIGSHLFQQDARHTGIELLGKAIRYAGDDRFSL